MRQDSWADLWNLFLTVMAHEPIEMRIGIGITAAFFTVMALTGIADSFLPRRAARRYAAMYDMTPAAILPPPSQQSFEIVPPAPQEEVPAESDDARMALPEFPAEEVNAAASHRWVPQQPKLARPRKP